MSEQNIGLLIQALAPVVGMAVTALVKWLVPQIPLMARPLVAIAVASATAALGGADPELALALGGSAVGVREVVDRTKKAVQPAA